MSLKNSNTRFIDNLLANVNNQAINTAYGTQQPLISVPLSVTSNGSGASISRDRGDNTDRELHDYPGQSLNPVVADPKHIDVVEALDAERLANEEVYFKMVAPKGSEFVPNARNTIEEAFAENEPGVKLKLIESEYSKALQDIGKTGTVPMNICKTVESNLWIEAKPEGTNMSEMIYKFDDIKCIQSTNAYAQGQNIPISDELKGNAKNAFVFEVDVCYIDSTFPCPVGIEIGQIDLNGQFVPYENAHASLGGFQRFHGIIYPNFRGVLSPPLALYRSGHEINEPYGAKYPWLTADPSVIATGYRPLKENISLLPVSSPLLEWIFENAHLHGWPSADDNSSQKTEHTLPTESKDSTGYYKLHNNVFKTALTAVRNKAKYLIRARDLTMFAIRLSPLGMGVHSSYLVKVEDARRKAESSTSTDKTMAELKRTHNSIAMSIRMTHAFRDTHF